jgi:cation diffusion facilitator family transporter
LYRIRQGKKMHSAALIADGMHARVDGFTSLGVAAGLALVAAGFERADPITGIIISVIIARIAWGAARDVGIRLLDGIEHEHAEPIETVVRNHLGDEAVRSVRGRWHGHVIHVEVFLDPAHTERVNTAGGAAALEHALREAGTRARQVALVVDRSPAEIIGQP